MSTTMTPRTRQSNRDQNFKIYYSKKVPQQAHFPHRRKTVRRPDPVAKDGSREEQTKLFAKKSKLKRVNTICDSEEEDEEDLEDGGITIKSEVNDDEQIEQSTRTQSRGRKRRSDALVEETGNNDQPANPTPEPTPRAVATSSNRRSKRVKVESEDEDMTPPSSRTKPPPSRSLRRQSTMTQLAEGRRPASDTEEPTYKPVKRAPRRSWGGQSSNTKDSKQRTLTQMVPGMRLSGVVSDDDLEEELSDVDMEAAKEESQAYDDAFAARLAREGLMQSQGDENTEEMQHAVISHGEEQLMDGGAQDMEGYVDQPTELPLAVISSVEDEEEDTDEETYQPTQFIDAPSTRSRRSLRHTPAVVQQFSPAAHMSPVAQRSMRKSKFGLLSTPEKRRIREIPSSQSPAESPLSARSTRSKLHRSPLKECSGNHADVPETPSKRKQVTFQIPMKEAVAPPTLRKFESTIQDSEDEEEDDVIEPVAKVHGHAIGEHTQAMIENIDDGATSAAVGAETQAILDQIDQACAYNTDGDEGDDPPTRPDRDSSEEIGERSPRFDQQDQSLELEEEFVELEHGRNKSQTCPTLSHTATIGAEQELMSNSDALPDPEGVPATGADEAVGVQPESSSTGVEFPLASDQVPSSPPIIQQAFEDTCPSTPMVIMDSSDEDDEDEPHPTPPRQSIPLAAKSPAKATGQSVDLNAGSIQVPQSPPTQQETQESHTSKAEQQLHSEWFSYSQYVNPRPQNSSSMHVSHDKFSYHATPRPPPPTIRGQLSGHYTSQATTVDEVTPKKNRTQRTISANTTPHKIASSQPVISPSKPPPLFIPSSFPSPTKVRMEDWSSPIMGNTQATYGVGASLEDFSIPAPPPDDDEWI